MPQSIVRTRPAMAVLILIAAATAAWTVVAAVDARRAPAQDADVIPDDADDTDNAPAAAAAPAPASAPQPAAPPVRKQTYLRWLYDSLGLMYSVIFLFLSFALVALVVMNVLLARRENVLPSHLIEGFESLLNAKKYQEAYELAKSDESFLGHVLSAGLARLSAGYSQSVEAMQEVGEEESMKLEHRLSYLALIGTISPMFGLLGTVDGMVQAFEVIARSTVSPKPSELADGIATALVTTLVGLWLAIPAIAAFGIIRNRYDRLILEVGIVSEGMMRRFQSVGDKKTP